MTELDFSEAWCVEEQEIARLKGHGHGAPKKLRRQYGRAIRYWRRKLRNSRSFSIPVVYGRMSLRKYGCPIEVTYDLGPAARFIRITQEQLISAPGFGLDIQADPAHTLREIRERYESLSPENAHPIKLVETRVSTHEP